MTVLYQTKGLLLNHEKLQAVVVNRNNEMKDSYSLNINQEVITLKTVWSCLVLKLTISFLLKKRISRLVKKASNQLNPISRIQKFMGFKEREILLNSSFYSIFNYCSLVWHFCSAKSVKMIEKKYQNELLEYFTMTFLVIFSLYLK